MFAWPARAGARRDFVMSVIKRLRVGVDFHEWDGIYQGSRSHVLGLYREAIRLSPDVDFVFFLDKVESLREAYAEFRQPNVTLVRMPTAHGLVRLGLLLPWLCWRQRLDVLHTQYRLPFVRPVVTVTTIHDVLFETYPQFFSPGFVNEAKVTFRLSARHAAKVLTVSQFSKSEICRHYQVDPAKVQVTYNGVDGSRFFPGHDGEDLVRGLGLEPGGYILVVGRLEPRKNHLQLIDAWVEMGASAPPLVIVGQEDRGFPAAKRAIECAARVNKLLLFQNLGDDVLPAVMRHAQLFVYPAFAEGFGMPVVEAMASGVPVITANTTSLAEVAGDGAVLFDPSEPEGLLRALRLVLEMPEPERQALVQRALAQAARFEWADSAQVLMRELRALVRR